MHRTLVPICLGFLTVAVFIQVRGHEFVNHDDRLYVRENPQVQKGLSWEGVRWAFSTMAEANWHPLTWMSLMHDRSVFGPEPAGFALVNLVLHVANTLLLFAVLRSQTRADWPSAAVAALFAIHPLHVEPVAWIAERKETLSMLLGLGALHGYGWYVKKPAPFRDMAVVLSVTLSLLAKQMWVTLPFLLLLFDYWPLGRRRFSQDRPSWTWLIVEKAPLLLVSAAFSVVALVAQWQGQAVIALGQLPFDVRLANAFISYTTYLAKTIFPFGLAPIYPHPGQKVSFAVAAGSALVLATISFLVFRARQRPYLVVGWCWYLGTLVPVIGLVQVGRQAMADRYTYLPLIGIFIMIAYGAADIAKRPRLRVTTAAVMGFWLAGLLLVSWRQVAFWQCDERLWPRTLAVTNDNYAAHFRLGILLHEKGDLDRSIEQYRTALTIEPNYTDALHNLGAGLASKGLGDEARDCYQRALQLEPDRFDTRVNLAAMHRGLADSFAESGDPSSARQHYERALAINPTDPLAHNHLGVLLVVGESDAARRHFESAVRLDPGYVAARKNLAGLLLQAGERGGALTYLRDGLRLSWSVDLANELAWQLATRPGGTRADAAEAVRLALRACEPIHRAAPALLDTLAAAYANEGRFDDAVAAAQEARDAAQLAGDMPLVRKIEARLRLYENKMPYRGP